MADRKLSEWIKEGMKKGYSIDELKEKALGLGYSEAEISKALRKRPKTALIAIILILAGIFLYFAYTLYFGQTSYSKCIFLGRGDDACLQEAIQIKIMQCQRAYNMSAQECSDSVYADLSNALNKTSYCVFIVSESIKESCLNISK